MVGPILITEVQMIVYYNDSFIWILEFNTTFDYISIISLLSSLLVEDIWVPKENQWRVTRQLHGII